MVIFLAFDAVEYLWTRLPDDFYASGDQVTGGTVGCGHFRRGIVGRSSVYHGSVRISFFNLLVCGESWSPVLDLLLWCA